MKRESIYKIFSKIPTLSTERFVLKKMSPIDARDMFEYACLEDVTKYLIWYPHKNLRYTRDYLEYLQGHYAIGDFYDWGIYLKENDKLIGTCGFTRFDFQNDGAEIGYVINPKYKNNGVATECASKIIEFGFEKLSLNRIEAKFMDDNGASKRVMEKLGMRFEGTNRGAMLVKGKYRDISVCAIIRSEFKGTK